MVALATAFVRLRPQPDKGEFRKTGARMGEDAGAAASEGFGKGFGKDPATPLRNSKGQFVKAGADAGGAAGEKYGSEFTRGADGRLRDSRGKFVKDSEATGGSAGQKAGDGFASGFGKAGNKLKDSLKKNLSLAAGVFVPLGLAGAVAEIGKIGIAYEDNLNIFESVSGATGQQMAAVAAKARELGADVKLPGVSAAGAAASMTELAKAGLSVQESMNAAQGTLQLARAAGIDEAKAAEITSNALNAFGLKASATNMIVDELAATANSSSVEIGDVADSFQMAAAVFSSFQGPAVGASKSMTELNTAIAILGNNGIKGSDAGTSLKQMLLQLVNPSHRAQNAMIAIAQAANGANGAMDELLMPVKGKGGKIEYIHTGMTVMDALLKGTAKQSDAASAQLDKMNPSLANIGSIAYDSAGKMRPLRETLDLLTKGLAGETQENRNAALSMIFGADATRSVVALMKGGIPVWDAQTKAVQRSGAAADVSAAKNKGLGGALDNVKSQIENASISVYNVVKGPLTNALNGIANALPGIFAGIGRFAGFIGRNIGVIRDWALAIGAVTLALRINSAMLAVQAAGGILAFIRSGALVTSITRGWAAAQALLNVTLIANPIGAIIIAITALVAGFILAYKHVGWFRNAVNAAWAGIKVAISAVVGWITGTLWPSLQRAWAGIAAGAMWLWHNAIEPVWNGIKAVIGVVVAIVKGYIALLVAEFKAIAAVAVWLWRNVFSPVWNGIKKAVEIAAFAIEIILYAIGNVVRNTLGPIFTWLWRNVIVPTWSGISSAISAAWSFIRGVFVAVKNYVGGTFSATWTAVKGVIVGVFNAVRSVITGWWNANVRPIFLAVKAGWESLAAGFSSIYNGKIRPLFDAFVGFIKGTVVNGFRNGVEAIRTAWSKVQEYAKAPVTFVVNRVVNPFIRGLNRAADIVGLKKHVDEIPGFRTGGQVGFRRGGKISGAGGVGDNRQAMIPGLGAVQLQGGEYVVDRENTAKALPILKWISAGMMGGPNMAKRWLGRKVADMPGDGSEGFAFRNGGLIGWAENVWDSVTDPINTIKKPFESLLNSVPGAGMIRDFLLGAGRNLLDGAVGWLKNITGGGGKVGDAVRFLKRVDGSPYGWANAGPNSWDCSGIVSSVYNILHGKDPYSHTFSTSNAADFFPKPGQNGPMAAAWSHPGQSPAGSVGHMMGRVGNMNFESTGSQGVHLKGTRQLTDFAHIGHYRTGGPTPVRLFDNGGYWPSGTLGANLSGRTEFVDANPGRRSGASAAIEPHFHFHAPVGDKRAAEDLVYGAWKGLVRDGRVSVQNGKLR